MGVYRGSSGGLSRAEWGVIAGRVGGYCRGVHKPLFDPLQAPIGRAINPYSARWKPLFGVEDLGGGLTTAAYGALHVAVPLGGVFGAGPVDPADGGAQGLAV